jgi:hypothetical protein
MPRISDDILNCVVYLYSSEKEAAKGLHTGGSGFIVAVPSMIDQTRAFFYVVTNSHVVKEPTLTVIRLNTKEGEIDMVITEQDEWTHHPNGDDLAVCPIYLEKGRHKFRYIHIDWFLTKEIMAEYDIGPGDEVFLVGRFINHEGKQQNTPSLRFGHIAMMPYEPIRSPRGIEQESFLVEVRSTAGYSGSPVFVYIPPLTLRPKWAGLRTETYGPWLLGVDWGHLPIYEEVREKSGKPIQENWRVRVSTGMAGVVPAWRLAGLLNTEELVSQRTEIEENLRNNEGIFDSSKINFARSDFIKDLKNPSRRKKSDREHS